jgi:prevent-host-death family protein
MCSDQDGAGSHHSWNIVSDGMRGSTMHEIEASASDGRLNQLLDRIEAGEEVVITRHGRAVAHLVPPPSVSGNGQAQKAAAAIRAMSRGVTLGGLSLRDLVAEGRR